MIAVAGEAEAIAVQTAAAGETDRCLESQGKKRETAEQTDAAECRA